MRLPSSLLSARAIALLGGLCGMLCACGRNAPGPEECERFAEIAVQLAGSGPLLTPEVQAAVEQQTRICLTQPYDYDLLRCVSATHQWGMCMAAFRRRTGRSL
ncbi:MAG: hypothetical protein ABJB12_16525 [Pseudomonadota bacterium]